MRSGWPTLISGGKQHVGGLGAQDLVARMAEGLLGRPVELGDDSLLVDGDDGIERGFQDGALSPLGIGQGGLKMGLVAGLAVDDHQAGGSAGPLGLDPKHFRVHVDEFAGLGMAEPAAALPAAALVDGRPGHVAQLVPRLLGVELAQIDGGCRLVLGQPHQAASGRIQIERLAVRGGQADELRGRVGQQTPHRIGVGPEHLRPIAHRQTPPHPLSL